MADNFHYTNEYPFSAKCLKAIIERVFEPYRDKIDGPEGARMEIEYSPAGLPPADLADLARKIAPDISLTTLNEHSDGFRVLADDYASYKWANWGITVRKVDNRRDKLRCAHIQASPSLRGHTTVIIQDGWSSPTRGPFHPIGPLFERFAVALIEECNRHTTSDFQERDELFSDAIKSVREGLGVTDAEDEQPEQPDSPPVPGRDADLRRWESTWLKVKGQVEKGKRTKAIAGWLRSMHPDLACHPDTLSKIIKAGRAELLNRHR